MVQKFFITFSSPFNSFTIIWKEINTNVLIERLFLSNDKVSSEVKALNHFKGIYNKTCSTINALSEAINQFLKGEEITFDLALLDFNCCYNIQKKVLLAEHKIPRGWVSTYQRIANAIDLTNGARVVGNALAKNPFPLIIPCHRAIRSNGELGGFQGGLAMKEALLKLEGISFQNNGKVKIENIYY